MVPPALPGSPEMSDDDSISVTYSDISERQDNYDYEGILAEEASEDGEIVYLTKWEGYPVTRSTWEPITSFGDPEAALREWEDQKMRVSRGYAKPFDVEKLEAEIAAIEEAQQDRRARRRAKRIRKGLSVSPSRSASEERHETGEAEESAEEALESPPRKSSWREQPHTTGFINDDVDDRVLSDGGEKRRQPKRRRQARSSENRDAGLSDDSLVEEIKQKENKKILKTRKATVKPRREPQATADTPRPPRPRVIPPTTASIPGKEKVSTKIYNGTTARGTGPSRGARIGAVGRGPSRLTKQPPQKGRAKVHGAAIFRSWDAPRKARSRPAVELGVSSGPSNPRAYNKLSMRRKLEKASRNEPAPNPDQIVLYNLKDGGKIVPKTVPVQSGNKVPAKTPHQLIMEQQAQTAGNKLDVQSSKAIGGSEPTAGVGLVSVSSGAEGPNLRTDQSTRQQAESSVKNNVSDKPLEPSIASDPIEPVTAELSSAICSPTRADNSSPPDNHQPTKTRSIPFTAYAQRRPTAQQTSYSSNSAQPTEPNYYRASQTSTPTTRNMGNWNSKLLWNDEHGGLSAVIAFGQSVGGVATVSIHGLGHDTEQLLSDNLDWSGLHFDQMVTPEDYRTHFMGMQGDECFATGDAIPQLHGQDIIKGFVEGLRLEVSGGICVHRNITVLIYPIKMDVWNFLDKDRVAPPLPNTILRFRVCSTISPQGLKTKPVVSRKLPGEAEVVTLFREMFGINYKDILPQNVKAGKKVDNVFVLCPSIYREESNLIMRFLIASGATIFRSQDQGAWQEFAKNVELGVVLLHPSFCYYHQMPHLASVLRRNINFFHLGMDPNPGATNSKMALTRLFPHGRAILLTEDLFRKEPAAAKHIVLWFHEEIKRRPAGIWKLVGRPGLTEWVLEEAGGKDGKEPIADLFDIFIALRQMLPCSAVEEGTISTPAPHAPIAECEEELFAAWASMKAMEIRRFFVVDPKPRKQWREWQTLDVVTPEEFIAVHVVKK